MELLKNDGTSPKDRMRQATANWNKQKAEAVETKDNSSASSSESFIAINFALATYSFL